MSEETDIKAREAKCHGYRVCDATSGSENSCAENLKVDSIDSITDASCGDEEVSISPRTLILASKSSEEEMVVSKAKGQLQHKWIEETLSKVKKPLSENTRMLLSRHSLPTSTSSVLPQGTAELSRSSFTPKEGRDNVLARARTAIEGRRQSRETARAKVSAAMALIGDESGFSISYSTSSVKFDDDGANKSYETSCELAPTSHATYSPRGNEQLIESIANNDEESREIDPIELKLAGENFVEKKYEDKNEVREKARARLSATMALLSGKSPGRKGAQATNPTSSWKTDTTANGTGKKKQDESMKTDRVTTHNLPRKEVSIPIRQRQKARGVAKQEILANEVTIRDERERFEKEEITQERQDEEKARRLVEKPSTERLEQEKLAAVVSEQVELEKRIEEKAHQLEQAKAKRVEEEKLVMEEAERAEYEGLYEERLIQEAEEAHLLEQAKAKCLNEEKLAVEADTQAKCENVEEAGAILEAEEARQLEQAKTKRLKKDRPAAEKAERAELESLEEERVERGVMVERMKEENLLADTAKRAKLERLKEEQVKCEDTAKSPNEVKLTVEAAKRAELGRRKEERSKCEAGEATSKEGDETENNEIAQLLISFEQISNDSSSYSAGSADLIGKPSETSDGTTATSQGQVDRILYQGKGNDPRQDDDPNQEGSENGDFEAISNSFSESASQSSNIEIDICQDDGLSPGPMWKKAAEEAAFATALKNDFLPRAAQSVAVDDVDESPSMVEDASKSRKLLTEEPSYSNDDYDECEHDTWVQEAEAAVRDDDVGESEWKGFKRDRMMFMVALGILGGLLPSLYCLTTCHFITGDVLVGEDEEEFGLYYGLQKFTPIDSVFQGYSRCQSYDRKYNYNPPTAPWVAGIAATLFGSIPLVVIVVYLRFSMTHKILWTGSMWMLYMAFVFQISTLSIFLLGLCHGGIDCSMGPGARASCVCSLVWFLLSMEMKINSPLIQPVKSDGVVVIEKHSPIVSTMKKIWQSIIDLIGDEDRRSAPSLSRTAMKKQKGRIGATIHPDMSLYRPPEIV